MLEFDHAGGERVVISVIVPVHNAHAFLGDCLASLDVQACKEFEVVLVDDGSTDGSAEVCDRYAKIHKNAAVVHTPNQGPLLARREGMRHAQGEYCLFLDSDDCLNPGAVGAVSEAIARSKADVICFGYARGIREKYSPDASTCTMLTPGVYRGSDYRTVLVAACSGLFNNLCDKVFRRTLVDLDEDYAPWRGMSHGEDLFQLLPVLDSATSLERIDGVFYFYRDNPASGTHSYRTSRLEDLASVFGRLGSYAWRWGGDCPFEAKRMAARHMRWVLSDLAYSDLGEGGRIEEAVKAGFLLQETCGDELTGVLSSLRLDVRLPLNLLVAGKPKRALQASWAIEGLYRRFRNFVVERT